jgi:ABC-2 type transport system permease protein
MIGAILRIFWIHLRRDRIVWLLTFIVPIAFFSIFAIIFSGQGGRSSTPAVRIAVVDEDGSEFSKKLAETLQKDKGLRVTSRRQPATPEAGQPGPPLTRADAEALVRDGRVSAAVILPKGLGGAFPSFSGDRPTVELLADTADPIAPQMLSGMLQGLAMTAAPDAMMRGGIDQLQKWGGPLTPEQRKAINAAEQILKRPAQGDGRGDGPGDGSGSTAASGLLSVKVIDVLGQQKANPVVAFYAAATAVMFLLFSCANGAGGSLIEEAESGTLDRLLSSNLSMTRLLFGKWISFVLLGLVQVSVMFVWGWLVFKLELFSHLPGFLAMTLVTAAAAAGFGLLLGTLCRTRGQLMGLSTTVILLMSAVGGSMFPRFLMSERLQTAGLLTFNAWALDGYQKVFWRDAPVWQLWPQLLVLAGLSIVFLIAARWLAKRWETV